MYNTKRQCCNFTKFCTNLQFDFNKNFHANWFFIGNSARKTATYKKVGANLLLNDSFSEIFCRFANKLYLSKVLCKFSINRKFFENFKENKTLCFLNIHSIFISNLLLFGIIPKSLHKKDLPPILELLR